MILSDLVQGAAARTPEALAVAAGGHRASYGRLDALSNRMARALAARGVKPGDRVAIWLEKSIEAVAAMQAVLRLGAAYVPIDPLSPAVRADLLLRDCGVAAVVTRSSRMPSPAIPCLLVDSTAIEDFPGDPVGPLSSPDDLAFILYTSGSTGVPKGVCITHRNALAFVEWAVAEVRPSAADVFANHAPFHFDLSVFDLYAAFSVGAAVHLVPEDAAYSPALLIELILRNRINFWYSVPSALVLMMQAGGALPESLHTVLFAGEVFPPRQLRDLRRRLPVARLLNLYGPTETNVCTFYELPVEWNSEDSVPIGKACSGDRVWAQTPDGGIAQPGQEGELIVDGPSVMAGYWGRTPQTGPYATGDWVRLLEDGNYSYIGRRDHMVKVHGYRIELGEIECAVLAHPLVEEGAAIVAGAGMEARIVAFLVCRGVPPPFLEMKRHTAQLLPRYMIPDDFRVLPALPRTRTGKIDRTELHALAERATRSAASSC